MHTVLQIAKRNVTPCSSNLHAVYLFSERLKSLLFQENTPTFANTSIVTVVVLTFTPALQINVDYDLQMNEIYQVQIHIGDDSSISMRAILNFLNFHLKHYQVIKVASIWLWNPSFWSTFSWNENITSQYDDRIVCVCCLNSSCSFNFFSPTTWIYQISPRNLLQHAGIVHVKLYEE